MATIKKVPLKKPAVKTALKRTTPAVKTTKTTVKEVDTTGMTPIQKAQAARARNKALGIKPKPKKPVMVFKPPADFKPFFMDVRIKTGQDGLIAPVMKIDRVKGRWQPNKEGIENRRYNMMEYDAPTATAFIARLHGIMHHTNSEKRLPANTAYRIIVRVLAQKLTETKSTLKARITDIARARVNPTTGKRIVKWLTDGKDLDRRRLRRASRFLAGAFINVQLPPMGRQKKAVEE